MTEKELKNPPPENARNRRHGAISRFASSDTLAGGLQQASWRLEGSFLKSLIYRSFSHIVKKTWKCCFNRVFMAFKRLFNKTGKIVQKSRKSQTPFLSFFDFSPKSSIKSGGF